MSETAPERAPAGGGRENVFTRRIGPLPMCQWLLIGVFLVGGYALYAYRKNANAAASTANQAAGTSTGGTTGAAQVPQFVNQTYTYVAPPVVQVPPPGKVPGTPAPAPAQTPAPSGDGDKDKGGSGSKVSVVQWQGPNLRGLTLAQATAAIQQAGYSVNNVSSGYQNLSASQVAASQQTRTVYSFTPYSNKTVNIGLM